MDEHDAPDPDRATSPRAGAPSPAGTTPGPAPSGPAPSRPGRLGIGVVGAGRVGPVLGGALRAAGHAVVGVAARSAASRERVGALLPGVPVLEVGEVVRRAELVLLAVGDDALAPLVQQLADADAWQPGQLVVHTSGAYGWRVLEPAARRGAIPLAVHPVMTFTGTSLDLVRLTEAAFGVSAPAAVLPIAQALVVEMGAEPVVVDESRRALYHAGLAHGANHVATLVAQALDVLRAVGVDDPARVLGPLVHASVDNALRQGDAALTGPVARGDAGTVAAHLAELHADAVTRDVPDVERAYRAMARVTADRALAHGRLAPGSAEHLLGVLGGPAS